MPDPASADIWWRNAVIYSLDVETFMDGNGDGVGDFPGLTARLDYLAGIGVTCVWLMPFYPTPGRDDGYDVTDFYGVDTRLGTLGDFVEFVRTARERGIRVIADLVVNHTSNQHPWFQQARADPDSPYRDFYIWSDEEREEPEGVVFPGEEDGNWTYDERAGLYYLHRFYRGQPDLNICHPGVRDEINRVIGFWLELGVSGFRVDAVPFLIGADGHKGHVVEDPHDFLKVMRGFLSRRAGDAVMLGEVNLPAEKQANYFGDGLGDELHMQFSFLLNGGMYLAMARGEAEPIGRYLDVLPEPKGVCQWVNFTRNHDELNVSQLPAEEMREVLDHFAPDHSWRAYDRGIRRRLAPLLGGDQRRLRSTFSLLFSLPGTPTLYYGEEIGMGDDLSLHSRMAVRTPMQWSDQQHGGFSTTRGELVRDLCDDPDFGYRAVNVAEQQRDPDSLLSWVERLARVRKECPEIGWGAWQVVETGQPAVFAHRCDWLGSTVVAVHNLVAEPLEVTLDLDDRTHLLGLEDLIEDTDYETLDLDKPRFEISGYGFRWLRAPRTDAPTA